MEFTKKSLQEIEKEEVEVNYERERKRKELKDSIPEVQEGEDSH